MLKVHSSLIFLLDAFLVHSHHENSHSWESLVEKKSPVMNKPSTKWIQPRISLQIPVALIDIVAANFERSQARTRVQILDLSHKL